MSYYCYIDLTTVSVFVPKVLDSYEITKNVAFAGVVEGIVKNDTIIAFLKAGKQMHNGYIMATYIPDEEPYCGRHLFSR